jgi:hypothetical protein
MSAPLTGEVGPTDPTQPMYNNQFPGGNKIGDQGCKYITKGDWEHLECLKLGTFHNI